LVDKVYTFVQIWSHCE